MTQTQIQTRIDKMRFTYLGKDEEFNLKKVLTGINGLATGGVWGGITGSISDQTDLISGGKILASLLPALAITDTYVVSSEAEMLALGTVTVDNPIAAETGDIAVRTDETKTYILKGSDPSVLADWELLLTPTGGVVSVFGRSGAVTAQSGDYSFSLISGTAATSQGGAPAGGASGYVLTKNSSTDYDYSWAAAAGGLPSMTGSNGKFLTNDGTVASWATVSAAPGGSSGYVQFNNAGSFAGDSNFFWDNTNKRLGINTNIPDAILSINGYLDIANKATFFTTSVDNVQYRSNYKSSTDRLWDNLKSSWALVLGNNNDTFAFYRAAPTSVSPIYNQIFSMNSTGYMGLGTASPGAVIHIATGTSSDQIRLGQNTTYYYKIGRNSSTGLLDFNGNQVGFTGYTFSSGSVGIGITAPNACALLDITSTTKGFLPPRMTLTQWTAIASKAEGLQAWNNIDHAQMWYDGTRNIGFRYNGTKFQGYDGTSWIDLN